MTKTLPPRLLALSPGRLGCVASAERSLATREFLARLESALAGGLRGLLLREPGLGDADYLELGREVGLRLRASGSSSWFGVHDRAHLVRELGADGLHLGFRSLPPREARAVVGADTCLGLSTHASDPAELPAELDYCFFGPIEATPSKQGLVEPVGLAGLERRAARCATPLWAIGGILPEASAALIAAGASGVAVLAGICGSPESGARAAAYSQALRESR